MTDNTNNPLNVTDEDIGKEGRFLLHDMPAVLIGFSRHRNGVIDDAAFKLMYADGREEINLCDLTYSGVTRTPRKLCIGVNKWHDKGVFNTTNAYSTRKEAEDEVCEGWAVIEIPHPEDVVK